MKFSLSNSATIRKYLNQSRRILTRGRRILWCSNNSLSNKNLIYFFLMTVVNMKKMKMNCFTCCVSEKGGVNKKTLKKINQEHKNNKSLSTFDNLSFRTGKFFFCPFLFHLYIFVELGFSGNNSLSL